MRITTYPFCVAVVGMFVFSFVCSDDKSRTDKSPSTDDSPNTDESPATDESPSTSGAIGRGVDALPPLPEDVTLPIVFAHGGAGSAQQYASQAIRFAANGYPQ